MTAIINYGLGNVGSIVNMLKVLGEDCVATSQERVIRKADRLILPGVGAFDAGKSRLERTGLAEIICRQALEEKKPVLGICLGMQLLGRKSEEGSLPGLGLIPFDNVRFCHGKNSSLKIPHMGWDMVQCTKEDTLTEGLRKRQRYYFVHSYHAVCDSPQNVLMVCDYGYTFAAAVCRGNIYGVQFHPEKSHDFGMALLKNFVRRCADVYQAEDHSSTFDR